jgi:hypothetical protein
MRHHHRPGTGRDARTDQDVSRVHQVDAAVGVASADRSGRRTPVPMLPCPRGERQFDVVALFLGGAPARSARLAQQANRRRERWVRMHGNDWCPTVATCWPRFHVERFLAYCDGRPDLLGMGDDNVTGSYVKNENVAVWATVPSLVEHPDVEPSLIRRKASAGRNRYRIAAVPPSG